MSWVVKLGTKDLKGEEYGLPEGQYITVKLELTNAEERYLSTAGFTTLGRVSGDLKDVNWPAFEQAKLLTWITEWHLLDDNGKPLKFNKETIGNFTSEGIKILSEAIDKHIEEYEAQKKVRSIEQQPKKKSG